MDLRWSLAKSEFLKRTRGVSFEDIVQTELIAALEHPGRVNQKMLLFRFKDYIWVVPCVARENEVFLKTLYQSRKYTKLWRRGELG